jgi:uncharacterized protein YkwD
MSLGAALFRRAGILLLLVALVLALPATVPVEARDQRNPAEVAQRLEWLINSARTGRGLPALRIHADVKDGAFVWSARMAWRGYIYHDPGLGQKMPPQAMIWAETVARTTADDAALIIRNAWFQSEPHRRILLDPRLTHLGVGIAPDGPYTYATARFWG